MAHTTHRATLTAGRHFVRRLPAARGEMQAGGGAPVGGDQDEVHSVIVAAPGASVPHVRQPRRQNGNLLAYNGPETKNGPPTIYLYNAVSKTNVNLFPSNTAAGDYILDPILSPDGSHIAVYYSPSGGSSGGIALKAMSGSPLTISSSDVAVPDSSGTAYALALSNQGPITFSNKRGALAVYANGQTLSAPALSDSPPEWADISENGSTLLYTLYLNFENYPGVYDWQIP